MTYRLARAFTVATVVALAFTRHDSEVVAQSASLACGTDMRLLVVAADGNEADLPAIKAAIDYIGTPYDVYLAAQTPGGLMPDPATGIPARLASGCRAKYQGVLLTTGDLGYFPPGGGYTSALRADEFTGLATYESTFKIRQVTWYTFPTPDFGLNYPASGVDTSAAPMVAQLTTTGAQVFPYIKRGAGASGIPIQYAWTYLTTPLSPTDTTTIPLLTNAQGNTLAAIHTYPDGRANLAMMFDSNPSLVHSMLLSYGVMNWVTSGLFIGDRHVYVSPQVDDLFIDDQQWLTSTPCGTSVDLTGVSHRLVGTDLTAVANWQTAKRKQALTANLRVTMAFNGFGTTPGYSLTVGGNDRVVGGATAGPAVDTLTPAAKSLGSRFYWVSHTYTHENLDAISYAAAVSEITQNNQAATTLPLPNYSLRFLVQPDVSGLGNANFLKAAFDNGLRYLLSNTSVPGGDNPTPNTGRSNALQPAIFVIPRRSNNLFFNVATPADWVAEYNCIYYSDPAKRFFPRPQSYSDILEFIGNEQLAYMLRGELDPWMYHQTNLAAYDGVHTLLTDLLDQTLAKYSGYYTLPVVSPTIDVIGTRMANRTTLRRAGINASIQPGIGIVLTAPATMTIPITGLRVGNSNESYGGQWISYVTLNANRTVTFPITSTTVPAEAPTVNAGETQHVLERDAVTLTAVAADPHLPPRPLTYSWTQTSGLPVTLNNANTLTPTFVAPTLNAAATEPAVLEFTLTASNDVVSASANTTVIVWPLPPTVTAGAARTVDSSAAVTLTAAASDPNNPPRALTYSWTQTSGPAVALTGADTLTPTFTAPAVTVASPTDDVAAATVVLEFAITVSNGPVSSSATTTVSVRPVVAAGAMFIRQVISSDGFPQRDASGITASAGDVLVAFVASGGSANGEETLEVSGGTGLTWRLLQRANAQLGSAEIWTATATAALTDATVSANQSPAGYQLSLTVVTIGNAGGIGSVAAANGATGAPAVTLATTRPGSFVLGVGNDWDNDVARAVPAGQALVHEYLSPLDDTMWVQTVNGAVGAAGTPVTLSNPAPTTDRWNYAAVEIVARQ